MGRHGSWVPSILWSIASEELATRCPPARPVAPLGGRALAGLSPCGSSSPPPSRRCGPVSPARTGRKVGVGPVSRVPQRDLSGTFCHKPVNFDEEFRGCLSIHWPIPKSAAFVTEGNERSTQCVAHIQFADSRWGQ